MERSQGVQIDKNCMLMIDEKVAIYVMQTSYDNISDPDL